MTSTVLFSKSLLYMLISWLSWPWINGDGCFNVNSSIRNSSNSSSVLTPILSKIRTIVFDPLANIRDPSSVLYDEMTKTWNFWATHIPLAYGTAGYHGTIYHYYCKTLNSSWNSSGIAINVSLNCNDFDSYGVFTPGIMYDNITNEWIIFYGGVANDSDSHIEQIGIAVSKSGVFGPFIKNSTFNPVITLNQVFWCDNNSSTSTSTSTSYSVTGVTGVTGAGSGAARVDEAQPYIIKNEKLIYTKGVCNNFTALEGIWRSIDGNTWNPPYLVSKSLSPLVNSINTTDQKGFENVKIFEGIDGYLHLTGHNHGQTIVNGSNSKTEECPHYVSNDANDGFEWKYVNTMKTFGQYPDEPAIVFPNGVPGDQGGIPKYFIQFVDDGKNPYYIDLMKVEWV